MKLQPKDKKETPKTEDDTLFGLLSIYKIYNTYFRILENKSSDTLIFQITGNPKKWTKVGEDQYVNFRLLKRSEIGINKLFVKYLSPEHIINQIGPLIGLKVPENEVKIYNNLNISGIYSLEIKSKYLKEIISTIEKLIELSPQRKYELLEKSLAKDI